MKARIRYILVGLFVILFVGVGYSTPDDGSAALANKVLSDINDILSGKLVLKSDSKSEYFAPTVKVIQTMLGSISDVSGNNQLSDNYLTPGIYNDKTKDLVGSFQVNAMKLPAGKEYIGNLGSTTLQEMQNHLKIQNKRDDIGYYIQKITGVYVQPQFAPDILVENNFTSSSDVNVTDNKKELKSSVDSLKATENTSDDTKPLQKVLSVRHVVQVGEVLGSIAEKYGISLDKLTRDNDIINPERIYPGQVLLIKKVIDLTPDDKEPKLTEQPSVTVPAGIPIQPKSPIPVLQPQPKPAISLTGTSAKEIKPKNDILALYDNQVLDQRYDQYQESRRVGALLDNLQVLSKQRKEILLAIGETKIFKNYSDIKKMAVGNPEVADTIMIDPQQMLVNAKKSGSTTLTVFDSQGRQDIYYIVVSQKSAAVQAVTFRLKNLKFKIRNSSGAIENRTSLVEALSGSLKSILDDKNFAIFVDLNTIVVQGTTDEIRRVQDLLDKIDRPFDQVLVTAIIAEVDKDSSSSLKFGSEGSYGNTSGRFNETEGGVFSYSLGSAYNLIFNQQLQALVSNGKAQLLATPKLLIQSGEMSKIDVIESIPFIQVIDNKPVVNFYDAGVVLSVFPQSGPNGTITSYVSSEVSNLSADLYQGYPGIQKRQANTVMTVRDGDTIIIAGLVKENKSEVVNKIPILGDIPFIGSFFSSTVKKSKEVELIISLTQHVIN